MDNVIALYNEFNQIKCLNYAIHFTTCILNLGMDDPVTVTLRFPLKDLYSFCI